MCMKLNKWAWQIRRIRRSIRSGTISINPSARIERDWILERSVNCSDVGLIWERSSSSGDVISFPWSVCYTMSQKVPTIKLSVTLSNLNRFSKFLHCWKAYKICYRIRHYPPHLRHVATLPWEIKNPNFLQIFSRYMEENANKLHFECTDFNSATCVTVHAECIYVLTEYLKYLNIQSA